MKLWVVNFLILMGISLFLASPKTWGTSASDNKGLGQTSRACDFLLGITKLGQPIKIPQIVTPPLGPEEKLLRAIFQGNPGEHRFVSTASPQTGKILAVTANVHEAALRLFDATSGAQEKFVAIEIPAEVAALFAPATGRFTLPVDFVLTPNGDKLFMGGVGSWIYTADLSEGINGNSIVLKKWAEASVNGRYPHFGHVLQISGEGNKILLTYEHQ
ncbi:MAG: hypothetical protein WCG27_11605, partial [Pseudomonadota bacterium]